MPKIQESDEVFSLCIEAILYGLYLQTLFYCLRTLLRRRPKHWGMGCIGAVLAVLVTLDIVLAILRLLQAKKCNPNGERSASQTVQWYNVVKASAVAFCSLLVEGVLIYRCWVVYAHRWAVIAVPLLLWLGGAVIIIWTTYARSKPMYSHHPHRRIVESVYTGFWALAIIMNVLTTTLIVRRIFRAEAAAKNPYFALRSICRPETQLQSVIRIVVESGLLCTTSSLFVFLSQAARSHYLDLASAVMIMIAGISFNLIIIRVERQRRKEDKPPTESEQASTLRFTPWDWRVMSQKLARSFTGSYGEDSDFEVPYLEKRPPAHLRGQQPLISHPAITSEPWGYISEINIVYLYKNGLLV